ncbi:MAG: SusD/RagB family nutrient-binding outer membrane lipoprotein, partial [Bacteroidaceae bacterium]
VLFCQAEGALRGWNMGGTAQSFYEQGIKKTFEENNVAGYEEYITLEAAEEVDFRDYHQPQYDIEGRVKIGVAWDETDTDEKKLEKIITQKYIGIFPMSAEAWTTFRRTGYPRLFPVDKTHAWADGSFDVELQIRRIPYESSGTSADEAAIAGIEAALQQDSHPDAHGTVANTAGTRLFWDKPTESRNPEGVVIPKNF